MVEVSDRAGFTLPNKGGLEGAGRRPSRAGCIFSNVKGAVKTEVGLPLAVRNRRPERVIGGS